MNLVERRGYTLHDAFSCISKFSISLYGTRRYSGRKPNANRNYREIEGLIGFFVNTLVYRANLSGRPTFQDVLYQVRQKALKAYEYQDIPFEKL